MNDYFLIKNENKKKTNTYICSSSTSSSRRQRVKQARYLTDI